MGEGSLYGSGAFGGVEWTMNGPLYGFSDDIL